MAAPELAGVPVLILKEGASRSRGREAQHANIMAAQIVAEAVKKQIIKSATEAASMILKVDDVIAAGKMKAPPTPPEGPPETEYESEEY